MGYKISNKVIVSRVIPMTEGAIIAPKRSHRQTVRSRQWHVTIGGYIVEKEF